MVILIAGTRTLTITVEEAAALAHELVMKRIELQLGLESHAPIMIRYG